MNPTSAMPAPTGTKRTGHRIARRAARVTARPAGIAPASTMPWPSNPNNAHCQVTTTIAISAPERSATATDDKHHGERRRAESQRCPVDVAAMGGELPTSGEERLSGDASRP